MGSNKGNGGSSGSNGSGSVRRRNYGSGGPGDGGVTETTAAGRYGKEKRMAVKSTNS